VKHVSVILNTCSIYEKYCFVIQNLKDQNAEITSSRWRLYIKRPLKYATKTSIGK
jgi:hypothetical protein